MNSSIRIIRDSQLKSFITQDYSDSDFAEEKDMYLQFNFVLSDVSAFLVDGDYHWTRTVPEESSAGQNYCNFFPVIEKCGIALKLQQVSI